MVAFGAAHLRRNVGVIFVVAGLAAGLERVVAGGHLIRGHRQPGQRRRRPGGDHLAEQVGHRVPRLVGQRPVERHVRQRAVP
jgi:hypothetical protein